MRGRSSWPARATGRRWGFEAERRAQRVRGGHAGRVLSDGKWGLLWPKTCVFTGNAGTSMAVGVGIPWQDMGIAGRSLLLNVRKMGGKARQLVHSGAPTARPFSIRSPRFKPDDAQGDALRASKQKTARPSIHSEGRRKNLLGSRTLTACGRYRRRCPCGTEHWLLHRVRGRNGFAKLLVAVIASIQR